MNYYTLCAPQLGEGVKSLKVIAFLKKPGEIIQKDEPVLEVETDKATMEIESSIQGILENFCVEVGDSVRVGEKILTIRQAESSLDTDSYAGNVETAEFNRDRSLRIGKEEEYSEFDLPEQQQMLIKRMRASESVIPALVQTSMDAGGVRKLREIYRSHSSEMLVPSSIEIIAWSVLDTMRKHPNFRSLVMQDDKTVRQYAKASVGIAVSLKGDALTMIKISEEECRDLEEFCLVYKKRLTEVRSGLDRNGPHSISISDLRAFNIHSSIPVIVNPAIATLCIGAILERSVSEDTYNFSFAFDHRIINGAGAARFLRDVKKSISHIESSVFNRNETDQINAAA